jgi:hypothetical protein
MIWQGEQDEDGDLGLDILRPCPANLMCVAICHTPLILNGTVYDPYDKTWYSCSFTFHL